MTTGLLLLAAALQAVAVAYGLVLRSRRRAAGAWSFLLGAMLSMLAWRVVVLLDIAPPPFFNPAIAIWGSTCMVIAMFLFGQEGARRERAEAERDALLSSERQARSDAERASLLKDEFLATLSHELRTPLASILGWCSLLRLKRDNPAEVDRALDTIERNANVQVRLVDDLLDATSIQAGKLQLDRRRVRLDDVVRTAVEMSRPAAQAKGIALEFAESVPALVDGDASRLQQIVINLLSNAVKFTPAHGHVRVAVAVEDTRAILTVRDDGAGIDPAFVPHVFTRFRQGDSSTTRLHGGLGLGLAIVSSLVERHGGTVRAESEGPGRGATFTVVLPLATAVTASARDENTPGVLPAGAVALNGLRVLVVDDAADVRAMVTRLLEAQGAVVAGLESGLAIESTLSTFRPDVLIIDIGMPVEDGYALIRRIRRLPAAAGGAVPALSLTAHARNEDRARAIDSGFQAHLPKPLDLPLLVSTLSALGVPGQAGRRDAALAPMP